MSDSASFGEFLSAPMPEDEAKRLAALEEMRVVFTPAEERFDRLVRMACRLLKVPIATVTLIDAEVQWFKAREGLVKSEHSRAVSFCAHTILHSEPLVVPDARSDPRFAGNPLVKGEPFIRFYAGHPIQAPDGSHIGTLCVIDRKPRALAAADLEMLRDLAAITESELRVTSLSAAQSDLINECDALKRKAMLDPLTGLWSRQATFEVLERELARANRAGVPVAVIMADIDNFKSINDRYGHLVGDTALVDTARRLREGVRRYDAVGRFGGEEFVIVLGGCDEAAAAKIAAAVRHQVNSAPVATASGPPPIRVSFGVASTAGAAQPPTANDLVQAADEALYRAKAGGGDRVELASGDLVR